MATRTDGRERRWRSSTGSRWSWGTQAGPVGLTSALCSRVGSPSGSATPAGAEASVSQTHPSHSTSTPPARTSSSSPNERISSMERVLTAVARGRPDSRPRRSTSSVSTP